ncbi:hypothetical protein AA313_de0205750 [Arthrobotrys entomopaga]|nr:hypothetical protein AA313_de0205750 [Arthrobotrys entomopaga]
MIAATKVEYLDLLLGIYQEIGDVLDGVAKYERLFVKYADIRRILEIYFYDVLKFNAEVLVVFAKPDWKRHYRSAWPTFKTKFEPILESLKRHRALLSDEKLTVLLEEVHESRNSIEEKLQKFAAEIKDKLEKLEQDAKYKAYERSCLLLKQKAVVATKLSVRMLTYNSDYQYAISQRYSTYSGDWILDDSIFKTWVHGMVASEGKTTLASRIIKFLQEEALKNTGHGVVVFFYFRRASKDDDSKTKDGMLRSLLAQLLDQDDTLLEYLYQQLASFGDNPVLTEQLLEELAKYSLQRQERVWLVLDGLDECDEVYEADKMESRCIIRWCEELLSSGSSHNHCVRIMLSAQRDGQIDRLLGHYPAINLDNSYSHIYDIEEYTKSRASLITEKFELDPTEEADLVGRVARTSNESPAELEEELAEDNFPKKLEAAYDLFPPWQVDEHF